MSPLTPIQTAPTASGTNEMAIHSLQWPTKSNFQRISRCVRPSQRSLRKSLVSASRPKMARVASTAVNSESSTPTKSVKAKPLTPAVANRNRIAAVANVTTLASMIAEMPFL